MKGNARGTGSLCSLDVAALLLEAIDGYDVVSEPGTQRAPSLVATTYDTVLGQVFVRLAFVDEITSGDVDAWVAGDPLDARLRLVVRDEQDAASAELLRQRAASLGRPTDVQVWNEFFAGMLRLAQIEEHYRVVAEEYYDTEGAGFRYVDQEAVIDDGVTARLLRWTLTDAPPGVTYVVAEYGEGKTSFCLNYVFTAVQQARAGRPIPLLFNLNEFEAGHFTAFVEKRLRDDYSLDLSFAGFRQLCRRGVIVPVFDAFDQMHNGEGGPERIERDHNDLMDLGTAISPLYVTCRMNFFEQHVRDLRRHDEAGPAFRVVVLRGFDQEDVRSALAEVPGDLVNVLGDHANQEVLASIHLKPLMLHVILRHVGVFTALLEQRKKETRASGELRVMTEYDVFDILYTTWLEDTPFRGLPNQAEAGRLLRDIASRVQLEGMNQPVPLSYLKRSSRFHDLVAAPEGMLAVREDLRRLPLLNPAMLRRDDPMIAFRFNAYLEFMTARAVVDELNPTRGVPRQLVKQNPLTWETRQMIAPNFSIDAHGEAIRRILERSRSESFHSVKFEASNVVTLILDCVQHSRVPPAKRQHWRQFLEALHLEGAELRRLDARGADLAGMNFSGADVRDADFSFALLRGANFTETRLGGAIFKEAGAVLTTVFVTRAAEDPERWSLAGGTENGMVVFWDSSSPHPTRTWLHREAIKALGAAGGNVISIALDGWVGESDPANPHAPLGHPLGVGGLRAMALSPKGDVIVGGDRRTLVVLAPDGREHHRLDLPPTSAAVVTALVFDDERDLLYAGDGAGDLYEFREWREPSIGRLCGGGLAGAVQSLAMMRDGSMLALVEGMGALILSSPAAAPERLNGGRPAVSVSYASAADAVVWHDGQTVWKQLREPAASAARFGLLPEDMGAGILSCSTDGSFVAAGGNRIVIWHEGRAGVRQVRNEPMRMDCTGMLLADCEGLSREQIQFITERGGKF